MSDPARNLELKVRCPREQQTAILTRVADRARSPLETLHQTDTYFAVAHGRLKLREIRLTNGERRCELIAYRRPDESGARWSDYRRVEIDPREAEGLLWSLVDTCGLLTIVDKRRTVGVIGRTRVHLDEVEGLGTFVELETVTSSADADTAPAELRDVAAALGLDHLEVIATSYSDLVLGSRDDGDGA